MILASPPTKPLTVRDIVKLLDDLRDAKQEHVITLTVDAGGHLINKRLISLGTVSSALIHPREVFRGAVEDAASGVFIAHCHPSGDPRPSDMDKQVTQQLVAASLILSVPLLDHVIIAKGGHFSFVAHGLIYPSAPEPNRILRG